MNPQVIHRRDAENAEKRRQTHALNSSAALCDLGVCAVKAVGRFMRGWRFGVVHI
ncbi:MAG TPA: hypothetical protein PLO41_17710 [Rubrivivax sp.]|nr:hypothetical protein [Rubrivivax sp.]